jgi:hypothetical protein
MSEPALDVDTPPGDVQAVALVLHGGRAKGTSAVRGTQPAVLRMAPCAAALRRAGRSHGVAVARLRYLVRGWNGERRSPVQDVEWALDRLTEWYPERPVALIGHSMGGRAAVYAAGHPAVGAVVGLAPWIERGDPYRQMVGRDVLVAHGNHDRMTSAKGSAAWTKQAAQVANSASYVSIAGEGHAMLRRPRLWHELTASYVLAVLCGVPPSETDQSPGANVVAKVLAGDAALVV